MLATFIAFLVMLNPFALFLYLQPVMKELDARSFRWVLFKASLISFLIFLAFSVSGFFIFERILQIHFEAFRIFGGIVIFSFAYLFIVGGKKALITMKEDLDDLASDIALPFMVGAGTISLSVLLGSDFAFLPSLLLLLLVLSINFFVILFFQWLRGHLKNGLKVAFDKNMEILLRLNSFFVGAIGLHMITVGIQGVFF